MTGITRHFSFLKKIILPNQTYYITTNIKDRRWIFVEWERRVPRRVYCDILIRNLIFYRDVFSFLLHGYVVMPDHVHLLLTVGDHGTICNIMKDWKRRTSFEANWLLERRGRLWQRDFWEHAIRNEADYREKLHYIHANPVRAGLVRMETQWWYSSARWYAGMTNPIGIDP